MNTVKNNDLKHFQSCLSFIRTITTNMYHCLQNTVKSTSVTSERPVATVCRQCHQTCLNSADGQLEDVNANCATAVSEFSSLDDACWGPLNFLTSMLSPTDPFNPLPHIAVLPPSPTSHDTSPVDNNPWEDAELSSTIEPTTATQKVNTYNHICLTTICIIFPRSLSNC